MSYKLQVAESKASYIDERTIWINFHHVFSGKYKTTSYKYVFFKCLLENLYNFDHEFKINYYMLFESFTKIYWNLVVHHSLNQINSNSTKSGIQNILIDFKEKHNISNLIPFDQLNEELKVDLVQQVKKIGKRYVVGALYGETDGTIYSFNNKEEILEMNVSFLVFMRRYQKILVYLSNYHLAMFLEKHNSGESTENLLINVENITKRNDLSIFYKILSSHYKDQCFYCGKSIYAKQDVHIDHFIPWSFIQADQLWNLVISCQRCNVSKSDKLAAKPYLDLILDRNYRLLEVEQLKSRNDITLYKPEKLVSLYDYSKENGYKYGWRPKTS